jgi:hypothetical protein
LDSPCCCLTQRARTLLGQDMSRHIQGPSIQHALHTQGRVAGAAANSTTVGRPHMCTATYVMQAHSHACMPLALWHVWHARSAEPAAPSRGRCPPLSSAPWPWQRSLAPAGRVKHADVGATLPGSTPKPGSDPWHPGPATRRQFSMGRGWAGQGTGASWHPATTGGPGGSLPAACISAAQSALPQR